MKNQRLFQKKRNNKKRALTCIVTGVFLAVLLSLGHQAAGFAREEQSVSLAEEQKTVKVGCYPLENFHERDETGNIIGYEAEYLERISWITGWNIEYVVTDSWNQAVELLRKGEIDLLSPAEITPERMKEFQYSAQPVCDGMGGVITREDFPVTYEDYEAFSEMMFGVELGTAYVENFYQYAANNHFESHIHYYNSYPELMAALDAGIVDGVAVNAMRLTDGYKMIGKFGITSYYFITTDDKAKLMEELNEAVQQMYKTDANVAETLLNKYYPYFYLTPFTKKEMDLLASIDSLKVGCVTNLDPICYLDEDGKPAGTAIELLNKVSEYIGIPFTYEVLPDGKTLNYEDIVATGVDLIALVEYNAVNAKDGRVVLSDPYLKSEKCIVSRRGVYFEPDMEATLGITSGSATIEDVVHLSYPNLQVIRYGNVDDALEDLQNGEVDFVLQNQYCLQKTLEKPKYHDLSIIDKGGIGDYQCLAVMDSDGDAMTGNKELSKKLLLSVLNKGIQSISQQENDLIIMETTTARHYRYTLRDTIYMNRYLLLALTVILLVAFGLLLYALRTHKKNNGLLKESARHLLREREELEKKSRSDLLTGLLNKTFFEECCRQYLSANPQQYSAFAFMDLDNFKQINDVLGHMNGDAVLTRVAHKIKDICQSHSYISRFGGDEFCILMTDVTMEAVEQSLQRMIKTISREYSGDAQTICLTASIGCVYFHNQDMGFEEITETADKALYEAKNAGKNQYRIRKITGAKNGWE